MTSSETELLRLQRLRQARTNHEGKAKPGWQANVAEIDRRIALLTLQALERPEGPPA